MALFFGSSTALSFGVNREKVLIKHLTWFTTRHFINILKCIILILNKIYKVVDTSEILKLRVV